jgi:hypothetical protein
MTSSGAHAGARPSLHSRLHAPVVDELQSHVRRCGDGEDCAGALDHVRRSDRPQREGDDDERENGGTENRPNDWMPHPKSMPLGTLANVIARMPSWPALIVDADELDLSQPFPQPVPKTNAELLEIHEQSLDVGREALSATTGENLMKPWRLRFGDKVLDGRPRYLILEDTIARLAHYRGQLTVYLRLNDAPVPASLQP